MLQTFAHTTRVLRLQVSLGVAHFLAKAEALGFVRSSTGLLSDPSKKSSFLLRRPSLTLVRLLWNGLSTLKLFLYAVLC